jgi:DNA-binding beta-propeller fold protein YncE
MSNDSEVGKIFGSGNYRFRLVEGWGMGLHGRVPGGRVCSVATDTRDRVYIFVRGSLPVQIFDSQGRFLGGWGEGQFVEPHSLWISPDDTLYLTDRKGNAVHKCTTDGKVLATWRTAGEAGRPFNQPQEAVVAPDGEMYITDHLNYQVHRYASDGTWMSSWGKEGTGPGEFVYPHSVAIDHQDRVLVTDRESSRLEIFDRDGNFLVEWTVPKPNDVFVAKDGAIYIPEEEKRKIDIFDGNGELLCQWGEMGKRPEQFRSFLHGLWLDSRGDLYVCGLIIDNMLQKFERV